MKKVNFIYEEKKLLRCQTWLKIECVTFMTSTQTPRHSKAPFKPGASAMNEASRECDWSGCKATSAMSRVNVFCMSMRASSCRTLCFALIIHEWIFMLLTFNEKLTSTIPTMWASCCRSVLCDNELSLAPDECVSCSSSWAGKCDFLGRFFFN